MASGPAGEQAASRPASESQWFLEISFEFVVASAFRLETGNVLQKPDQMPIPF